MKSFYTKICVVNSAMQDGMKRGDSFEAANPSFGG